MAECTEKELENELEYGCNGSGETDTDYILDEGLYDNLPTLYEQDLKRFYYNQGANSWSKKSCTIFASAGAVGDLMNYKYSLSELKAHNDKSYTLGRMSNAGWDVKSAVDMVCKDWNEKHPTEKVAYYRIDMRDTELVKKVLEKNYDIVTGFYGNVKWQNDYYEDAILNGTDFGARTYGHCICLVGMGGKIYVKDNYDGRTGKKGIATNVYELEHAPSEINYWHNFGYVITKMSEDNIEELKRLNEIKSLCNTIITDLGTLYNKVNDNNFQSILHYTAEKLRKKIKDADEQIALKS